MTEIRRGAQAQGTDLVSGAVSVARSAARTADRLSRSIQQHLDRVARQNEELDRQRQERQQAQRDRQGQRDRFLATGLDPSVTNRQTRAPAEAQPDRGPNVTLDYSGHEAPAATVNAVRDANRTQAGANTGAYMVRGQGMGPMLRVDYGDGPVTLRDPTDREILREVVEQNPRAYDSFASWVTNVLQLRGEPVSALNAERVAMARRAWETGGEKYGGPQSSSRAVPFDASFVNSDAYVADRGNVNYEAHYGTRPTGTGAVTRTSEPQYDTPGQSPAEVRIPLTSDEINRGQSDLMQILQRNRRQGAESRAASIRDREARAARVPDSREGQVLQLPNILRTQVRTALAERDAQRRLEAVQAENENIRQQQLGAVGQPKQDSGATDAKASDAAANQAQQAGGGLRGIDRLDGEGGATSQSNPGPAGVTVSASRTLSQRADAQNIQGTQSRLDRLEQRIRNSPLAPVAAIAGVAAGAEVPIGDTGVSASTDGVKGRWRW